MVRSEEVEDVVSAPRGVNAIKTERASAGPAAVSVVVGRKTVVAVAVGGREAVTGVRLRFAVVLFGFLTAMFTAFAFPYPCSLERLGVASVP
jgi:hypothetical protein